MGFKTLHYLVIRVNSDMCYSVLLEIVFRLVNIGVKNTLKHFGIFTSRMDAKC